MARKSRAQRPSRTESAPADAFPGEVAEASEPTAAPDTETVDRETADTESPDPAPASMRDAMRAALDAKSARRGGTPGSGPRGGSNGPAARGGGAKGFRALPRRNAG